MKKSIRLFGLLMLIFLASDRIIHFGLESLDKKVLTGQSVGKVNQFILTKDSLDLVIFGNSRANHHIDNKVLDESSYNMGVDGTHIGYSAALVSILKKNSQTIIVHVDPKIIFDTKYEGKDILKLINLISREKGIRDIIYDLFPEEIYYSRISNCYVYNGKALSFLKNYFIPKYDYNAYYGYDPIYPSQEQIEIFKKIIIKDGDNSSALATENNHIQINQISDRFVEVIKNHCKLNNSRLIFITSPTLKAASYEMRQRTKSYFQLKNIDYYDFSNFIDSNKIEYWKDYTHMSEKGASLFTSELKRAFL